MQSGFLDDFGGPHFDGTLVDCRGRLRRLHKGGGNQEAALAESRAGRLQSAHQFQIQMALAAKQQEEAAKVKAPVILPPSPAQRTDETTLEAARDQSRNAKRRFSFASTRTTGANAQTLGGSTVLGGGYTAAP